MIRHVMTMKTYRKHLEDRLILRCIQVVSFCLKIDLYWWVGDVWLSYWWIRKECQLAAPFWLLRKATPHCWHNQDIGGAHGSWRSSTNIKNLKWCLQFAVEYLSRHLCNDCISSCSLTSDHHTMPSSSNLEELACKFEVPVRLKLKACTIENLLLSFILP